MQRRCHRFVTVFARLIFPVVVLFALLITPFQTEARIVRIVIDRTESPTFEGALFGSTGQYEKLVGRAFGEVDPGHRLNALIEDIKLAPRNGRGAVEYQVDLYILKPVDMSRGNHMILYDVVNRGRKLAMIVSFNRGAAGGDDPTTAKDAGDGFLQTRGYTIVWSGWQGDLLPGAGRLRLQAPVATQNGAVITGRVRAEFIVNSPTAALHLSSGAYTGATHASYDTVSFDTSTATLTKRIGEGDPRVPIPSNQWAFADCNSTPFPGVPSSTQICLQGGFDPNFIYELIYTAKNPVVLGLGFAATRDLVSFLRYASRDDGTPNPLAGSIQAAIMHGVSQSGRFVRSFLDLGFNEDESGRIVFEGMHPHIAAARIPLNVRFGQPGRAYGQHEDHLFPANEAPLSWMPLEDPIAARTAGLLERCQKSGKCPKIIQTVTSTEYWQGRMSLNTTDPLARRDVDLPDDVRIYLFSGTQHVPAPTPGLGICQQPSNPNSYREGMRALLVALEHWVRDGVAPPPSQYPLLGNATLVPPEKASIGWPDIPGVKYLGLLNRLTLLDFGERFNPRDESGAVAEPPVVVSGRDYRVLAPKVDADGNEIAGIRSVAIRAPVGTHTGWDLRRWGFSEDELCGLQGMFLPFKRTRDERDAVADPRPSLQERYHDHAGYVNAVKAAANALVAERLLLPEDAARFIADAEASDVMR